MHPQAPNTDQNDRSLSIPDRNEPVNFSAPQRDAAANIVRNRIDHIYETAPPNQPTGISESPDNPYNRTHDAEKSASSWQQYHNAWQNYYQQYYHRYYLNQLHSQRSSIEAAKAKEEARRNFEEIAKPKAVTGGSANARKRHFSKRSTAYDEHTSEMAAATPRDAIKDELLEKIQERAQKLRRSTHFMPIISALIVGILFISLQYNRLIVAQVKAYVVPGSATSQSIIVDPTIDTKVGPEPRLIIPKINVDVPVVYGVKSLDNNTVQDALRDGVVHYPIPGANSLPGQVGNNVILGHSSNDVFDPGAYKFAFVLLERLEKGDTFYINYESTRYTYTITEKKVINPTQIDTLILDTDKPMVSLVTCTPIGTDLQRLVVYAEQISPDPKGALLRPVEAGESGSVNIPGNSPTLLDKLFGS
jgi:sortase A